MGGGDCREDARVAPPVRKWMSEPDRVYAEPAAGAEVSEPTVQYLQLVGLVELAHGITRRWTLTEESIVHERTNRNTLTCT